MSEEKVKKVTTWETRLTKADKEEIYRILRDRYIESTEHIPGGDFYLHHLCVLFGRWLNGKRGSNGRACPYLNIGEIEEVLKVIDPNSDAARKLRLRIEIKRKNHQANLARRAIRLAQEEIEGKV